jgi:triacylglycerol lipase
MKLYAVTIAAGIMLLPALSCRKGINDQSAKNPLLSSSKEQVAEEPVTPLDQPIALPSGTRHVAISSMQNTGSMPVPVILVHGLGGFGPGEMAGYNYWGGFDNIPLYLTNSGYPAYATSVGAFSSNWDRAQTAYPVGERRCS